MPGTNDHVWRHGDLAGNVLPVGWAHRLGTSGSDMPHQDPARHEAGEHKPGQQEPGQHEPAGGTAPSVTLPIDAVGDLTDRAEQLSRSQSRLRDLIRVNNDLTSNLDLEVLLRRIVEVGTELMHARYGAMGVIADDQTLEQFITVGMDRETVAQIGPLPQGKGLLGALITNPEPVRLATLGDDSRSSGFPAHHPPMKSFLGVPIRVRDEVYGNLYLTDSLHGEFSVDDQELAVALAASAGIAIANARMYEDSQYREKWASALAETARRLIAEEDEEHLGFLVDRVNDLGDADLVCIARMTSSGELMIGRAVGTEAEALIGESFPLDKTACGDAMRGANPVVTRESGARQPLGLPTEAPLGNSMAIPFTIGAGVGGVLVVARHRGRAPFSSRDLEMVSSFASHISVVIDRAESRTIRRRVARLEDRSRIARDLHDHVIQRLFAIGLNLQAAATDLDADSSDTVNEQVREIDASIAQIRQSIFALHHDSKVTSVGLRSRVLEIIDRMDVEGPEKLTARVSFLGPVDLMSGATLGDDITAVVTESLVNVVRHADATTVDVVISASAGRVSVDVTDDGIGPGKSTRRSGLANLRARADRHDGSFEVAPGPTGGTRVTWSVPT